jgi:UDP-N-acetylglucosamine:LPS N-acetylglucosamine transferase
MHGVIRAYHPAQVKLLTAFWREQPPDMVVSLVPNFNRALFQSLRKTLPQVPFVSVLTDLADYPPHFWMEKQPQQYFICGTPRALEQTREIGHPASRAFLVSGMILRPPFYQTRTEDRTEERRRLGLDPAVPTGLVLFGGEGSNTMYSIAERLGNSAIDLQLILICGRNERLRARLASLKTRNKLHTEGFTKEIPYFMNLCDFFIGKPGPGSISEAVKMNLPVIVESNSWTLPQERYNAEWVREQGVGIVLRNFRGIEAAVRELLLDKQLAGMKDTISKLDNQAVFEVARLLQKILESEYQLAAATPA